MAERIPFQIVFYAIGVFVLSVLVLEAGQVILMPLVVAVIAAVVLWQVVAAMDDVPVIGRTPSWLRHIAVLLAFMVGLMALILQVKSNIEQLIRVLPAYQSNLDGVLLRLADQLGIEEEPSWQGLVDFVGDQVEPSFLARRALAIFSDMGGQLVLIVAYTTLLLIERARFVEKIFVSFQQPEDARRTVAVLAEISDRTGTYLYVKTVINIALGVASWLVLLLFGIEQAEFWAIVIGVLNYVPYAGSLMAVMLPLLMAIAQTGSLLFAAAVAAGLVVVQLLFAYAVEPRIVGERVNLSPIVVLFSLAFWYALWGLPGAILAVPLTVICVNILAAFPRTRAAAVLLSNDGRV